MIKYLPAFLALFFASGLAAAQQSGDDAQQQKGSGEVALFVFDGNVPVSGAQLLADGEAKGETGKDGGLVTSLPAGRHSVVLQRDGEEVLSLDLLTAKGEQIRIIATLQEGEAPELNIESSGTGPVLAEDAKGDGQKAGLLEGTITAENGQPVADARVRVPSRGKAVRTDENGVFQIELPPGNYAIKVSHPDYASQTAQNLRVIPGKAVTADLALSSAGVQLADYTVTADYEEGSIASELSLQRESPQVVSVIGAEQISRTGDSNAAEALQRVSGLLIERDKYVVIRGQPFRYSLTQLNGLALPSPDPIIQAVPLDLFPAGILANIQVQKNYSFDQPGNFGAGLIGLSTRSVPDEPFVEVKVSTGGNDFSTGEEGLTYDGSDEDFLGQDGGQRELPAAVPGEEQLSSLSPDQRAEVGRSFNDLFLPETKELPADIGLEAVGGRSFPTQYGTFGFVLSGSYEQKWRRNFERDITYTTTDLTPRIDFEEERTDRNVQISSLLGLSANWENHSVESNTFFIRDSQDRTQISEGFDLTSGGREERRFLLEFQRRELLLTQLLGEHDFDLFQVDWRAQSADAERDRPDRRDYSYQRSFGTGGPLGFFDDDALERQFNEVDEDTESAAVDITVPLMRASENITPKLKIGGDLTERDRESQTRRFEFEPTARADLDRPFIEQIINDDTIGETVTFNETTLGTDQYQGDVSTNGMYVGADVRFGDLLQVVAGLRRTEAEYHVETDNGADGGFDADGTLPSLSVTGFVTSDMQVRGAYGESVAYPRLVELSETTFFNPDTGEAFIGNPDLLPTEIKSYDLRWEWYPTAVEALTAGVFYKDLTNTIEQQFLPVGGGGSQTTFVNGESGEITGIEVGGRVSLDRLTDWGITPTTWSWLDQAYLQSNVTLSDSEVDIGGTGGGVATNQQRALTGQADATVNLQLGYDGPVHDFTLVMNRIGERLDRAGVEGRPDVFQEPSTFLDFTYAFTIREDLPLIGDIPYIGDGQVKLKGQNLLDEEGEYRQGGELQRRIVWGRSFSASLKWNFF